MNAMEKWLKEHGAEDKSEFPESEHAGQRVRKIEDAETILDMNKDIVTINDAVFTFKNDATGETKEVKRYFYGNGSEYSEADENTWSWRIPLSVHRAIVKHQAEYGNKLKKVKVKKSGTGINTKYDVFPLLE